MIVFVTMHGKTYFNTYLLNGQSIPDDDHMSAGYCKLLQKVQSLFFNFSKLWFANFWSGVENEDCRTWQLSG